MASRIKKLVHRKKHEESGYDDHLRDDEVEVSALPYDEATTGVLPTTGELPIKGRDSGVIYDKQADRPERSSASMSEPFARSTIIPVKEDSGNATPNNHDRSSRHPIRSSGQTHDQSQHPLTIYEEHDTSQDRRINEKPSSKKHLGSPSEHVASNRGNRREHQDSAGFGSLSNPDGPVGRHTPSAHTNDGQAILEDAKQGVHTEDTTITTTTSPPVTHETIHQHIHHIRSEQITREIHNHDVFHRIQPIIDVEVLPTRHLLPTSDGRLVQVDESSLPASRQAQNWVIAETASKIPSGQVVDRSTRRPFSARRFPGEEGDAKRYVAPDDGYERTEQTWVHWPELETGARETGQSWPLEMGELSINDEGDDDDHDEVDDLQRKQTQSIRRKPVEDAHRPVR